MALDAELLADLISNIELDANDPNVGIMQLAEAIKTFIEGAEIEVTVTIDPTDSGLQTSTAVGEDTDGPSQPVEISGTGTIR